MIKHLIDSTSVTILSVLILFVLCPNFYPAFSSSCDNKSLFFIINGKQKGPFDCEKTKDLIMDGTINKNTLVWYKGLKQWIQLKDCPELSQFFNEIKKSQGKTRGELPPPLPTKKEVKYFLALDGKQHGPFKKEDVIRMIREGKVIESTLCWKKGMDNWAPISTLQEFKDSFKTATKVIPSKDKLNTKNTKGLPLTKDGLKRFMVGTWTELETDEPDFKVMVEVRLSKNGTAKIHEKEMEMGQPPQENEVFNGFWQVVPVNKERLKLIFCVQPCEKAKKEDMSSFDMIYLDHDHLKDLDSNAKLVRKK